MGSDGDGHGTQKQKTDVSASSAPHGTGPIGSNCRSVRSGQSPRACHGHEVSYQQSQVVRCRQLYGVIGSQSG